ncbi:MAG: NADH-quinone oxidoreductase subunit M [Campylobacter sp.]|nr:NADH-quinone oxidoreductase subunit M [Campylobacter sp.]
MLTLIIFFPAFAAMLGFVIEEKSIKVYGASIAMIEFLLTLFMFYGVDFSESYDLLSFVPLIPSIGINYLVGVDGISIFLVIMSAFMTFIALFSLSIKENLKHLVISVLFLEMTMMGVFLSLDVALFYVFWELSLLPMLYIIGAWGSGNRIYASVKFFIYTFFGSVFMLAGIIFMAYLHYKQVGVFSFSLLDWQKNLDIPASTQIWLFIAFSLSFAIKTPMFPFHTWLPYAHGQAPTIGSVLLAAVLLKMGTYGFVRFSLPLFGTASQELFGVMATLAVIMVIYTALIAYAQDDMKQVIAYSSISHMGIIILGIFSFNEQGISGAVFLMISHGIVSGALFMMVGMLYDRTHTKLIKAYGGMAKQTPYLAFCFGVTTLASIGLPLTIGFVGEFLSLVGIFMKNVWFGVFGGLGIIVGAIYMLSLLRRVFYGKFNEENSKLKDLNLNEMLSLIPLIIVIIALGIFPNWLLKPINLSVDKIIFDMQRTSTETLMIKRSVK